MHDLEHGAVWLAYAPDLRRRRRRGHPRPRPRQRQVIAAPYPDLAAGEAVVATAWARQLRLDDVDDPRLAEFVEQYQDGIAGARSRARPAPAARSAMPIP